MGNVRGYALPIVSRVADDTVLNTGAAAVRDMATVRGDGAALPSAIDGVVVRRVPVQADHRGTLMPLLDVRDEFWAAPVVYSYCFTIRPGVIKGWGMHEAQMDRYFVARGSIRVVLFDDRELSPSRGTLEQIYFTPATPGLVSIPPGVWHADQNWGNTDAIVMNFPTLPYNAANPDKLRIDPHAGVIPFDWSLRDG